MYLPGLRRRGCPGAGPQCVDMIDVLILSFHRKHIAMPTYHVEMMEGRTVEQKKKLVAEITRVSVEILGGAPESVDIIITDIQRENWATGGKLWSEPRE